MGGNGSGRKSPKFEAVKCLMGVQMDIWELINDFSDDRITRGELEKNAKEIFKRTKVAQEKIEGM